MFLLLKKLKNTESAHLCALGVYKMILLLTPSPLPSFRRPGRWAARPTEGRGCKASSWFGLTCKIGTRVVTPRREREKAQMSQGFMILAHHHQQHMTRLYWKCLQYNKNNANVIVYVCVCVWVGVCLLGESASMIIVTKFLS